MKQLVLAVTLLASAAAQADVGFRPWTDQAPRGLNEVRTAYVGSSEPVGFQPWQTAKKGIVDVVTDRDARIAAMVRSLSGFHPWAS